MDLKSTSYSIIRAALQSALPDSAVKKALEDQHFSGNVYLVAIGKAAWQMAFAAHQILGGQIKDGIVITKYNHVKGEIGNLSLYEAGHPVPDVNSFSATQKAIEFVSNLSSNDTVLFLISGGGSSLFELPLIPHDELTNITEQLLRCGADIVETNTIRKRLSAVKGGKFASICFPASVFSIVLSDIIGDPLEMIASGPAYKDQSTKEQALEIIEKYALVLSERALALVSEESNPRLDHVKTVVTGSVTQLCYAAADECKRLHIEPRILTASLCCTARDAGSFFASMARYHQNTDHPIAFIAGGETVVKITGTGLGGRNQELALAAAEGIQGMNNVACFSVGSDGTDGPTDAAGGYVDGFTFAMLQRQGISISDVLKNNDAYHALQVCNGLIFTGATGTNVNDISVLLIDRQ